MIFESKIFEYQLKYLIYFVYFDLGASTDLVASYNRITLLTSFILNSKSFCNFVQCKTLFWHHYHFPRKRIGKSLCYSTSWSKTNHFSAKTEPSIVMATVWLTSTKNQLVATEKFATVRVCMRLAVSATWPRRLAWDFRVWSGGELKYNSFR